MARPKSNGSPNTSTATIGFETKLWLAADKLRNNMDAAEYKHVVLGLIFLKYISDTFEEHRAKLLAGEGDYAGANPEDPDEYKAENVFWVPADARWSHLQANAKQPSIGKTVDDAMVAIERDNPRLKGVLPKDYARPGLDTARRDSAISPRAATPQSLSAAKDNHRLGELIDLIATISLTAASEGEKTHRSVDLLGRVYDWSGATKTAAGSPKGERGGAHQYFLTRFASAEGKNGGVAKCEVRNASVEVQKSRPFVIRNSSFDISRADIGKEHADTFRNVQHPDLRADWQFANAEVRMWN
jgi:type I restriction enzyme M protein